MQILTSICGSVARTRCYLLCWYVSSVGNGKNWAADCDFQAENGSLTRRLRRWPMVWRRSLLHRYGPINADRINLIIIFDVCVRPLGSSHTDHTGLEERPLRNVCAVSGSDRCVNEPAAESVWRNWLSRCAVDISQPGRKGIGSPASNDLTFLGQDLTRRLSPIPQVHLHTLTLLLIYLAWTRRLKKQSAN